MSPENLLTAAQLAAFLGVKPTWVEEHTRSSCRDRLPHYRLGSGKGCYTRFRLSEVEEWLKRRRQAVVNG